MLIDTFRRIEAEMNATFAERQDPIRGVLVGLLSRQHVLFLGPPGTAKSALARDICERIDAADYFQWLLTRFSTPEELFGPVSLKALEQDSYRRITAGKLPEAHVAFLDEIWKANSAILNALLSLVNERIYHNDGKVMRVPLMLAIGASNELPEDRDELGALWDRFGLRYTVDYVRDPAALEAIITGIGAPSSRTTITLDDVRAAQAEVDAVVLNGALKAIIALRAKLAEMGIAVSDRRWKAAVGLLKANAWLDGRTVAGEDDVAILAHAVWQEPNQIVPVRQAVLAIANPMLQQAADMLDQARDVHAAIMADWQRSQSGEEIPDLSARALEAHKKLKQAARKLASLLKECQQAHRDDTKVKAAAAEVDSFTEEVLTQCLGLSR